MKVVTYTCERCGASVTRESGRQGRGRFCSIRCARAVQTWPSRLERFWAKVDKSGDCWVWTGSLNLAGYGVLSTGPRADVRRELAHRVSWEIHNSPIADGLSVLHRCDNRPCVRPDHLFLGTRTDNNRDRDSKGRQRSLRGDEHPQRLDPSKVLRGSRHGRARLTEDDVRLIRQQRAAGVSLTTLTERFGVTTSTISAAATGRKWKHVE